uniref:P1-P2 n=2 Tax=Cotton leafroll dwarf virus TaxID=312295 RepID=A0A6B9L318_9VIRU|nr:P1-P2 [Cotton leafroll dwarf virus]
MSLMSLFSFVLFFFSFRSSLGEFLPRDSLFPVGFEQTSWLFQEPPSICPRSPNSKATISLPCICPPAKPLVDQPAKDLLLALWSKITDSSLSISALADVSTFKDSLKFWQEKLESAPKSAGQFALHMWAFALWQFVSWSWYLVTNHFLTVAVIVFLYLCTTCMVMMLRFLFGGLLGFLIRHFISLTMKAVWGCYTKAKSSSSYVREKAVEGFLHFTVPQKPPRSSVLLVQHPDGSHVGYATCILLYNGEYGLLTAEHVWNTPGAKVVSTKGDRNKIPISEFQQILSVVGGDLVILRGPPSWNSLLSTKAVPFTTQSRLEKGKTTLYSFDGEWKATNGEVVGTEGKFAAHLSNTSGGHSGTPLFHGKCVVGVHVGASKSNNWNLAATIPTVSGLTSPNYAFETTAPQGRVFDEAAIENYESLVRLTENLVNFQPKSGKKWADYSEEDDFFVEASETLPLQQPVPSAPPLSPRFYPQVDASPVAAPIVPESASGNGTRRSRPPKQGKPTCHPRRAAERWSIRNGSAGGRAGEQNLNQLDREGGSQTSGIQNAHSRDPSSTTQAAAAASEAFKDFQNYFHAFYNWQVPASAQEVPGFQVCGTLPQFYYAKQKGKSPWGEQLCAEFPQLEEETRGFGWPQFGPQAELKSLQLQAARWLERAQSAQIPSKEQRERVIQKTVEAYASCRTNRPAATARDVLSWPDFLEDLKEAVHSLELDAGVGVPYVGYGLPTHRGWVEDPKLLPVLSRLVFDRLQKMSEISFESMTAEELVQAGLCDPIRLFVKGEPHKQAKLDEGRYRLIMSVSLVDQLVARVLFQAQNKREIALWRAIPSKPGFGLSTDGQTQEFLNLLANQMSTTAEDVVARWREYLVPTDCSGFDWSVADWMLHDEMEVRNRLTVQNNELTRRLRACWLRCISNSVLCLSDGTLLAQRVAGVQKSGSYNTSSSNSRIRVMSAYHCGASWAMAMGDDALESVDTDLSVYKQLGFKVEVSGELEFCSHIFLSPTLAVPVNRAKMLYKLIHGYNPGSGNLEVISNYLNACFSVLNELRSDPDFVTLLYSWLVTPVLPQKNDIED